MIGGLITATLLTLVVLPALYARFSGADTGGRKRARPLHLVKAAAR